MTRDPFDASTGCSKYSFTVPEYCLWSVSFPDMITCPSSVTFVPSMYVPAALPFCSIPPFTTPVFVPREPQIIVPDIMLPDDCFCITCDAISRTLPTGVIPPISGMRPFANRVTMELNRSTQDCCMPGLEFDVQIPCLPLAAAGAARINRVSSDSVVFKAGMVKGTDYECRLSMDLEINLAMGGAGPTGPTGDDGCPACEDGTWDGPVTTLIYGTSTLAVYNARILPCWATDDPVCLTVVNTTGVSYRANAKVSFTSYDVPTSQWRITLKDILWLTAPAAGGLSSVICHGYCAEHGCDGCLSKSGSTITKSTMTRWYFLSPGVVDDLSVKACWKTGDAVCLYGLDGSKNMSGHGTIESTPTHSGSTWTIVVNSIVWDVRNPTGSTLTSGVMCHGTCTAGPGLPTGHARYEVLQLDSGLEPIWDWVRAHS